MAYKDKDERIYPETPYGDLPSVTTVLAQLDKSGPLVGWATKTMVEYLKSLADDKGTITITKQDATDIFKKARAYHKQISETALEIGSGVHNLIEVYLKGQPYKQLLTPDLKPPFDAFLKWEKDMGFKFIATERKVCSPLKFAGTLDGLAIKDNKVWLIDFKTSKAIYDEYLMQISAYRHATENGKYLKGVEWFDSDITVDGGVGVLRLDKVTGLPEWKEYSFDESNHAFGKFVKLVEYWWLNKYGL